ncbi:MAG: M48 family metallopeptidase [Cellvibrionaceae bacterium]
MTNYRNPKIPEGINVSPDHPLKEFAWLIAAVSLGVICLVVFLAFAAEYLVRFIPFETEVKLAKQFNSTLFDVEKKDSDSEQHRQHEKIESYLQELANKISIHQELPEGMAITVHYIDDDTVNAFATLGGHIFMFRGLIEKLSSENALSMVLGHEIAHIKHRDPIVSLGRGITIGLALASLTGFGDSSFSQGLVGNVGLITSLKFGRDQETEADSEAMKALHQHYGHAIGADEIFSIFKKIHGKNITPEILTTHPMDDRRIAAIKDFNKKLGTLTALTPEQKHSYLTPLPITIRYPSSQ